MSRPRTPALDRAAGLTGVLAAAVRAPTGEVSSRVAAGTGEDESLAIHVLSWVRPGEHLYLKITSASGACRIVEVYSSPEGQVAAAVCPPRSRAIKSLARSLRGAVLASLG